VRLIVATLIVFAAARGNVAQVLVPPGASLDVQIPVAPVPVRVGGKVHLAYELHITNFRAVDVSLTRIEVSADKRAGGPHATYQDADLRSSLARVGAARTDASDKRVMNGGTRVVFFVWLALDDSSPVPSTLHHRISFNVLGSNGGESGAVEPARVDVRRDAPVVLDPPLRGGPWVAVYDPSMAGGHRRALFTIDGKARIPARYAIDWLKVGDSGYGADVLAVGDGVVVSAVDGFPEPTTPITLDNAGGNYVTLDLGGGRFAFYEHLKPGSIRVKRGDRVTSGHVLALLGSSGSVSSGAHLHFHVSDANSPLGAEGLPFVFRSFDVLGAFESIDALASGKWVPAGAGPRPRRMEMPFQQTVLRF
jgi:hypothetical protein